MKALFILLAIFLISFTSRTFGQVVSDDAKRHFDRGMAAIEMAKSPDDYAPAINEFKQAVNLAPNWPDAYYYLGKAQESAGKISDAILSYRQYLIVAPNSNDAEALKTHINKLEFKNEQDERVQKVYEIMASSAYTRKQLDKEILIAAPNWGGGLGLGPAPSFRMESGKLEANNFWGQMDYHPQQHPPITRIWEPVTVNGRLYEYSFSHYMDISTGYVVRMDYEVKGEITSIDPPRVKETVKCSIKWGAPIEGNRRRWSQRNNVEEVAEYTFEYHLTGTN